MVMKKNAMRKNLSQSILKSFGRYLAIILIIVLMMSNGITGGKSSSSSSDKPWKDLGVSEREYMEIYNHFKYGTKIGN